MTALGKVTRHKIESREQWLAMRAGDLTASDIPSWCGCGYQSPLALYSQKKGRIGPAEDSPLFRMGRWFEPAVAEALFDYRPTWEVRRSKVYLRSATARMGGTIDMLAIDPDRPGVGVIQAKVVHAKSFAEGWPIDEGADCVIAPLKYQLQTVAEKMLVQAAFGAPVWSAIVALQHGYGADLHIIEVPEQPETEAYILERVADFWHCFDNDLDPAVDPTRDAETVTKLFPRDDGSEIDLSSDNLLTALVDQRTMIAKEINDLETQKKSIETTVKAKMGSASIAHLADGGRLSWKIEPVKGGWREPHTRRPLKVLKAWQGL